MSEIVHLARVPEQENIVAQLEELLVRAKAGEFKTFMTIAVLNKGGWITRASGYSDGFQLTGILATALQEQLDRMTK